MTRQGPGRPLRWMAALDKIRLTGLLRKSPAPVGLFYWSWLLDCAWLMANGDRLGCRSQARRRGIQMGRTLVLQAALLGAVALWPAVGASP